MEVFGRSVNEERICKNNSGSGRRHRINRVGPCYILEAIVGDRGEREVISRHRVVIQHRRDRGNDAILCYDDELRIRTGAVLVANVNPDAVPENAAALVALIRGMHLADDGAVFERRGVRARFVSNLRLCRDPKIAVDDLGAANGDVILKKADTLVQDIANDAIRDGREPARQSIPSSPALAKTERVRFTGRPPESWT
jgi:hypothetical protein